MNQTPDLERLGFLTAVLNAGLPEPEVGEIPEDVAQALELARIQMTDMPDCLADLAAAKEEFADLNRSIERLLTLAGEAAGLPEGDQAGRDQHQAEFVSLARVVARYAGRRNYDRPQLSLASRPQAMAAASILRHLIPVLETEAARLEEQESLIIESLSETLCFLETIARVYPTAPSLSGLPDLLERAACFRTASGAGSGPGPVPEDGLH